MVPVAFLDERQPCQQPLGLDEMRGSATDECGVLCMGRPPASVKAPVWCFRPPGRAANSDAYLTRHLSDRLEIQLYMRILGGRYWD